MTPPGGTSGIKGSNWFRWWWNYSENIKVKRLANKTTHRSGSSGMGNTTKWSHMIGQVYGDDGMREPRFIWKNELIKWQSREGKWEWFHFYRSLKSGNSAWSWFHFYTSLKQRWTMLRPTYIKMNKKAILPRVPHQEGEKHLGNQDPMPLAHYARQHLHWVQTRGRQPHSWPMVGQIKWVDKNQEGVMAGQMPH